MKKTRRHRKAISRNDKTGKARGQKASHFTIKGQLTLPKAHEMRSAG